MSDVLDLILVVLLLAMAIMVIRAKDLVVSVIMFGVYGLLLSVLWQFRGAPDVALAEAAVGAGVTTVLFLFAIERTERRER